MSMPNAPVTERELAGLLPALGWNPEPGGTLLVQASLRRLGPVEGEEADPLRRSGVVARALREATGQKGTLVAYTATPENSQTSRLYLEQTSGLSPAELAEYHARMPAFDPEKTPCSPTMGWLSEAIRLLPGARRSAHPQTSFAAVGPLAERIVKPHPFEEHLGPRSPLGRLYDRGAHALLLGLGMEMLMPLHLIDYFAGAPVQTYRAKCQGESAAYWRSFEAVQLDDLHFPELARRVLELRDDNGRPQLELRQVAIGGAVATLVPVRDAVDLADKVVGNLNRPGAVTVLTEHQ
ncbi:AAC(3) family N-acetyltransferase [Streptacidiphilus fuscans]|uniref:Aminoglycoside N(3)-acetyltransferase n=1 Tax=Streptacidiphilus fuscans TaxID=2789292 RepID=A0A931BF24_9ACTN|nr:AAC(3) family N-acetyltransferase [Streptacidiphilus fuscans]MBF9072157.1 AAC(3) family N-acetyltransferase [Streptacidiphilus fuscans]MBF9072968.1 AAC(3) family N-acetyltransferase [Streptacidiphilus fuscans]